jgi:hypothetical protein
MAPIFVGRTSNALRARGTCFFPGCTRLADHRHHVVYFPEEVVKPLCNPHHKEITMLNGLQARKCRHELSNSHRWWIWYQWIEGRLKQRRTAKALEYVEAWDQQPSPVLDSMARPEEKEHSVVSVAPAKRPDNLRKNKKKESKGNVKHRTRN